MNFKLFCVINLLLCFFANNKLFATSTLFPQPKLPTSFSLPAPSPTSSASPLPRTATQEFNDSTSPLPHIATEDFEALEEEIEDPEIPSEFKPSHFFIDRMHDDNKKWKTLPEKDRYWKDFLQGLACRARIYIKEMIAALPEFLDRADTYSDRKTPLQLAQLYGYNEMEQLLLSLGAKK